MAHRPFLLAELADVLPVSVDALVLFGSQARATATAESDVDVLVLSEDDPPVIPDFVFGDRVLKGVQASHYTRSGLKRLLSPPSLFAWHLRAEGVILFDRSGWYTWQVSRLQPFLDHLADLSVLQQVLEEAKLSLSDQRSLLFDAGVLATIARNAALIFTHFLGRPDFGPMSPLSIASPAPVFPIESEFYLRLIAARRAGERGGEAPSLHPEELLHATAQLEAWLRGILNFIGGKQ